MQQTYQQLVPLLKTYIVSDRNGPIQLERMGGPYDGGYVVPVPALQAADVLLGYGIAEDISFEEQFSEKYAKPSFGFDCGIHRIKTENPKVTFINECIGDDKHLYRSQISSAKIHTFKQIIQRLQLANKKIFIKMDIEGSEYQALPEILSQHLRLTGLVLEIHCFDDEDVSKALQLLRKLSQEFVLVHVHGNNYAGTKKMYQTVIPRVLELTYIHSDLIQSQQISPLQKHPLPIDMPNHRSHPDIAFEVLS